MPQSRKSLIVKSALFAAGGFRGKQCPRQVSLELNPLEGDKGELEENYQPGN